MAVMMPVAVVVAKYSAIIDSGDPRIDIGQAVPQYNQFMVSQVGHMMFALLLKPIFSWRMRRNFRGWPAHTPRRSDRALLQSVNR